MTELDTSTSIFDALRLTDEAGEYWSGRDLMRAMSYDKWERFEDAVERARTAIYEAGDDPDQHASRLREAPSEVLPGSGNNLGGRPRSNYRFTRYGAYMVAMNGDVRKRPIALAQLYFATKTRLAEVAGASAVATPFAIPTTYAEALRAAADQAERAELAEAKVAELEPKADLADTYLIAQGGTRKVREAAKLLHLRERDLRRMLIDERLVFTRHARCGDVQYDFYAEFAHHFQAIEHIVNHTWGSCSHYTLVITPRGMDLIKRRMARIALPADEAAAQLAVAR